MRLTTSASASASRCEQDRVELDELVPALQVQLGLGRAGRARVQRHDRVRARRAQEERQPDRQLERRPQLVGEDEVVEPQRARADRAVVRPARASSRCTARRRRGCAARPARAGGGGLRRCGCPHTSHFSSSRTGAGRARRPRPATSVEGRRPPAVTSPRPRDTRCMAQSAIGSAGPTDLHHRQRQAQRTCRPWISRPTAPSTSRPSRSGAAASIASRSACSRRRRRSGTAVAAALQLQAGDAVLDAEELDARRHGTRGTAARCPTPRRPALRAAPGTGRGSAAGWRRCRRRAVRRGSGGRLPRRQR